VWDGREGIALITSVEALTDNPTASPAVVLVVEDDFPVRKVAAEYLREAGYRVIEATSAADSMQVIAAHVHVDIVFADFRLPGSLTGRMLAEWLSKQCPDMPLLLTSGYSTTLSGFDNGRQRRFIPKPYDLERLTALIEDML
jgi:DNA-binding NtrC family response regulator